MSRRILVVIGHPDPSPDRLCRSLAKAYGEGAQKAGHAVRRVDLAALEFPMLRTMQEFEHGAIPDSLKDAAEAIVWAQHIVFVFPLWLGTMPAMLKAFLEQVMRPGTAFAYPDKGGGFTKTLLRGRSARVVVTMGMPSVLYPADGSSATACGMAKHPPFCERRSGGGLALSGSMRPR